MRSRVLDVSNVSVKRDGKILLQDISFSLDSMETLSIIGPKGAGKGLLLKTILGIHRGEMSGTIESPHKMGLVSQSYPSIDRFTVFENLSLVAKFAGVQSQTHLAEEIEEVLKSVNLWGDLKGSLHEKTSTLSDYQKCCLDLARTLILKPSIILLDKPTLTFDPEKKTQYEAVIEKLKNTISFIWVNHDLEQTGRVSDKVLFLKEGRMIEFGSAEQIFTMPMSVETENFISRRIFV